MMNTATALLLHYILCTICTERTTAWTAQCLPQDGPWLPGISCCTRIARRPDLEVRRWILLPNTIYCYDLVDGRFRSLEPRHLLPARCLLAVLNILLAIMTHTVSISIPISRKLTPYSPDSDLFSATSVERTLFSALHPQSADVDAQLQYWPHSTDWSSQVGFFR